jgi:hypothetical protein
VRLCGGINGVPVLVKGWDVDSFDGAVELRSNRHIVSWSGTSTTLPGESTSEGACHQVSANVVRFAEHEYPHPVHWFLAVGRVTLGWCSESANSEHRGVVEFHGADRFVEYESGRVVAGARVPSGGAAWCS